MYTDVHTHAFHPKIAHKVLAQLEDHYSITPQGTGLTENLLDHASKAGIERVVVHTAATDPSQVIPANNWAIALEAQYPGRVTAFGSMHPGFPDPEKELDRIHAAGIRGLKIHADFQGFRLDDPKFGETMEMIGSRFVIMFHVGDRLPPEENPSCPLKLATLRRDFPGPAMIAAHMGGWLHWQYALEHLVGQDVYLDTSSTLDFIDDDTLRRLMNAHPRERILFGSDYPLFLPDRELESLRKRLALKDSEVEEILNNTDRILPPLP